MFNLTFKCQIVRSLSQAQHHHLQGAASFLLVAVAAPTNAAVAVVSSSYSEDALGLSGSK